MNTSNSSTWYLEVSVKSGIGAALIKYNGIHTSFVFIQATVSQIVWRGVMLDVDTEPASVVAHDGASPAERKLCSNTSRLVV